MSSDSGEPAAIPGSVLIIRDGNKQTVEEHKKNVSNASNLPGLSTTEPLTNQHAFSSAAVDPEKGAVDDAPGDENDPNGPTRSSTFMQRLRRRMTRQNTTPKEWDMPVAKAKNPGEFQAGYPRLAAHLDSETNTHLYRRFGYLRTRSLLYMQDELVCLERKLRAMDEADAAEEPYRLFERAFDVEDDPKRQVLFREINGKLKEYDETILRQKDILALRQASTRDWTYYARYLWATKPLSPEDMEFIWLKDDMVDLYTHAENTWMRPMVEAVVAMVPQSLLMFVFRKKHQEKSVRSTPGKEAEAIDSVTQSLVDGRLELVFKIIIVLLTVVLLLVPVALLYLLDVSAWTKLVIVFIFIALFTTVTLFMTQAKRNEVFVSVATYSAVLVVFLGNLPSPTSS